MATALIILSVLAILAQCCIVLRMPVACADADRQDDPKAVEGTDKE